MDNLCKLVNVIYLILINIYEWIYIQYKHTYIAMYTHNTRTHI